MPTPYDDRYVGKDVSILDFGGRNVIAKFRRATVNITFRFADVTAVMDSGERSRPTHYGYSVDFEELIDSTSASALDTYVTGNFGEVTFQMQRASTGDLIEGNILLSTYTGNLADEAQVEQMSFQGTGNLSVNGTEAEILPTA